MNIWCSNYFITRHRLTVNSLYVDRILGRVNLIIETLVIITLQGPSRGHTNVIESQHKVAAQLLEDFFAHDERNICFEPFNGALA